MKPKSKQESMHVMLYKEIKNWFFNTRNREGRFEKEQYQRAQRRNAKQEINEQLEN